MLIGTDIRISNDILSFIALNKGKGMGDLAQLGSASRVLQSNKPTVQMLAVENEERSWKYRAPER